VHLIADMTLSQRSFALKTESRRREHQEAFSVCRRGVGFRRDYGCWRPIITHEIIAL